MSKKNIFFLSIVVTIIIIFSYIVYSFFLLKKPQTTTQQTITLIEPTKSKFIQTLNKETKTIDVYEKINSNQIKTAKITYSDTPPIVTPIDRSYDVSAQITKNNNGTEITPIITISTKKEQIKIKGKTQLISKKKDKNGIIFELAPTITGSITANLKPNAAFGLSANWLKYNDFRFLSPGISINTNKEIQGNIDLIKYNTFSNSYIGIGINSTVDLNYGIGISFGVNL